MLPFGHAHDDGSSDAWYSQSLVVAVRNPGNQARQISHVRNDESIVIDVCGVSDPFQPITHSTALHDKGVSLCTRQTRGQGSCSAHLDNARGLTEKGVDGVDAGLLHGRSISTM